MIMMPLLIRLVLKFLDSIALSSQDAKIREKLMAIVSSSNVNYEEAKSVFPISNKYYFNKKYKNKDENEGVKKCHRNKMKKPSVEDIASFCARNDKAQDVVYRAFNWTID